jgi:hypothetical protein
MDQFDCFPAGSLLTLKYEVSDAQLASETWKYLL